VTAVLETRALQLAYDRRAAPVVTGVDLRIERGEAVGLVGESGSGKSTLARALVGALRPVGGDVLLDGDDLSALHGRRLRAVRRRIQLVPQDSLASLNPRMTIGAIIDEGLDRDLSRDVRAERVATLLDQVALPAELRTRYPHELSGGQRQRVALARALAVRPVALVADEITSALDCSVQASILALLRDLRAELELTLVFVSHDLAVVSQLCDSVAVLYRGALVERGTTASVFGSPSDAYTRRLLASAPRIGAARRQIRD
jgi:ABC-type glutathione transport system ATPase component